MQTVKNKPKNIRNKYLKFICKDKNFILSLKQPKNVHKELAPSSFISNFKNFRKPGTHLQDAKDRKDAKYISNLFK